MEMKCHFSSKLILFQNIDILTSKLQNIQMKNELFSAFFCLFKVTVGQSPQNKHNKGNLLFI